MSKTVLIKQLRDATYASFLDCAQALDAHHGDFAQALAQLQAANASKAEKKAARDTHDGLIIVRQNAAGGCVIELNCETDFVARTAEFKTLAHQLAERILDDPALTDTAATLAAAWDATSGHTVEQAIKELVGKLGENIQLGRVARYTQPAAGTIEGYVHAGAIEGYDQHEGRLGVLVELTTAEPVPDAAQLQAAAHSLALQIASNAPRYVAQHDIPAAELDAQRATLRNELRDMDKPDAIKDKIIAGRLNKFYQATCLLAQAYLLDESLMVTEWLAQIGSALGTPVQVRRFDRIELN